MRIVDIETYHNHFTVTIARHSLGYAAKYWVSPSRYVRPSNGDAKHLEGKCINADPEVALSLAIAEIDLLDGPILMMDEGSMRMDSFVPGAPPLAA